MNSLLNVKNLFKIFGDKGAEVTVLNGVDLDIRTGEFVAIMGQSGSGKSTLLYNISGMDKMTSGTVTYDGEDISNMNDEEVSRLRLRKMGFIFQHSYLLKNLSIEDNILLPGVKAGLKTKKELLAKAGALMKKLEIENVADHPINQVSGGQMQRAAICRALINEPKVIFADEPTGALNTSTTKEVMELINGINREGTAVVLVTHDAKVASHSDRIIYLADGNVEAECVLGKYSKEDDEDRKVRVEQWLVKQGF